MTVKLKKKLLNTTYFSHLGLKNLVILCFEITIEERVIDQDFMCIFVIQHAKISKFHKFGSQLSGSSFINSSNHAVRKTQQN
jgi:hypothetical protein